jgi:CBS-domain-containing membrane protein
MRLLDTGLRHHVLRYLWQSLAAGAVILVVLMLLDAVQQTAIIASLGASAFIVFAAPRSYSAEPRAILGGYAVGTVCGIAAMETVSAFTSCGAEWNVWQAAAGAAAVALSLFVMTVTDTEHPPAAGLGLAFVLNPWDAATVAVVIGAAGLLTLAGMLLKRWLLDLV